MKKFLVRKTATSPVEVVEVSTSDDMWAAWKNILDNATIERIALFVNGITLALWVDENGLLRRLPPNLATPGATLVGPVIVSSYRTRNGHTQTMNKKEEEAAQALFAGTANVEWPKPFIPEGATVFTFGFKEGGLV